MNVKFLHVCLLVIAYSFCFGMEENPEVVNLKKVISKYKSKLAYIERISSSSKPEDFKEKSIARAEEQINEYVALISQSNLKDLEVEIVSLFELEQKSAYNLNRAYTKPKRPPAKITDAKISQINNTQQLIKCILAIYFNKTLAKQTCNQLLAQSDMEQVFESYSYDYNFYVSHNEDGQVIRNSSEIKKDTKTELSKVFESVGLNYQCGDFNCKKQGDKWTIVGFSFSEDYQPQLVENLYGKSLNVEIEKIQKQIQGAGANIQNMSFTETSDEASLKIKMNHNIIVPYQQRGSGSSGFAYNGSAVLHTQVEKNIAEDRWVTSSNRIHIVKWPKKVERKKCSSCNGKGSYVETSVGPHYDLETNRHKQVLMKTERKCSSCRGDGYHRNEVINDRNPVGLRLIGMYKND